MKIKAYILKNLFPHLKLKDKNISKPKKAWIYFEIFSQIIAVSYIALFLNLHHLFKYHYKLEKFDIYSNQTISKNNLQLLYKAQKDLAKTPIYDKNISYKIFLTQSDTFYNILTPTDFIKAKIKNLAGSYGSTYVFGYTIIRCIDLEKNQAFRTCHNKNDYKYSARELLSHELIHTLQYQTFGLYKMLTMSQWVREGYPTYASTWLSKQKNFNLAIDMLKKYSKKQKLTLPELYPLSALAVKSAIEDLHYSVKMLHTNPPSKEYILKYIQNKYLKESK